MSPDLGLTLIVLALPGFSDLVMSDLVEPSADTRDWTAADAIATGAIGE